MIAALYVARGGCYYGLPDVDPWGLPERDARDYAGPHPVVAHPPCQRWGRYWHGGPMARVRMVRGDDGGCFAAAIAAVRRWGGVLEHPAYSSAWRAHGIAWPLAAGWHATGDGGWTCCVEQGHYGHRARKATWLVAYRCDLPSLRWGASASTVRLDAGYHTAEERRRAVRPPAGMSPEQRELMGKRERTATPLEFRDLLLSIAATAATNVIPSR